MGQKTFIFLGKLERIFSEYGKFFVEGYGDMKFNRSRNGRIDMFDI